MIVIIFTMPIIIYFPFFNQANQFLICHTWQEAQPHRLTKIKVSVPFWLRRLRSFLHHS